MAKKATNYGNQLPVFDKKDFAQRVFFERSKRGLTQEQLAEMINRSVQTISRVEQNFCFSYETAILLSWALNIPLIPSEESRGKELILKGLQDIQEGIRILSR